MADGDQQYEYVAVETPKRASVAKGERFDDVITRSLNAVAEHGWRLVAVLPGGQYGGGHAIFERPVGDDRG